MSKKVNRLTILLEPLEKYFQQDGYVIFWKECKEYYRNQTEEKNIQSLSFNENSFSLSYAEQFEDGWQHIPLTLEKYYRKKLVESLNWVLKEIKLVTHPTETEKKEYTIKIQKLEELANNQNTKSFGIDLMHVIRKLYLLDENKSIQIPNASKFLQIEFKTETESDLATIHSGLKSAGFIKSELSNFKKFFISNGTSSNNTIYPIKWLGTDTEFCCFYVLLCRSLRINGTNKIVKNELWEFANQYFLKGEEKTTWKNESKWKSCKRIKIIIAIHPKFSDIKK
jgi:hypothetical protein